eukprot:49182_1
MSTLIIITSLLFTTFGAPIVKVCENWNECQSQTIDANTIQCLSFIGCQKSSISSRGRNNEIKCYGSESCAESDSLKSINGVIDCAGHRSCASISPIEADKLKCSGSYSCTCDKHKIFSLKATDIICSGWKACDMCRMSSNRNTICEGSNSCTSTKIKSAKNIVCGGSKSCSETKLETLSDIKCSGESSCRRANMKADMIKCDGINSCTKCKMNAETIIAEGFESLKGAEIDSIGLKKMKIKLSGEAATSDTSIICRDDSNCDIECIDQCNALQVIVMSKANIHITVITTTIDPNTEEIIETIIICENSNSDIGCPQSMHSNDECLDEFFIKYFSEKQEKK